MIFRLILILVFLTSCNDEEINTLKQEIHELRTEVRELAQLKYEIEELKKSTKKAPIVNDNGAILEKDFKSNSFEQDDPFLGDKNSSVVLMMFTDHECKLCINFLKENLEKIKKEYTEKNQIKFILRDNPLSSNTNSLSIANLTNCAGEQGKYWETLNYILSNQAEVQKSKFAEVAKSIKGVNSKKILRCMNRERYKKEIENDKKDARSLGITGVPSFYVGKYANDKYAGYLIRGAQPYNFIKTYIDKVIKSE